MDRHQFATDSAAGRTAPEAPRGFMARIRNYFLTGLIVAGPIAITSI